MKKKVMLGMSGGVDSSVAAALLVQQGYDVIGVTMKLWQDDRPAIEGGCCSLEASSDAKRVADKLGIPHYVMNFSQEFKENVIDYFIDEYTIGHTPNPCIACNKKIKFDLFLKKAQAMGIDYIASGHYAKAEYNNESKRWLLKRSKAVAKDQTYVLYNMTQHQLEHTLFPLGDFEKKDEVRKIAAELGFRVANKPDSQEICFVDDDYGSYIESQRKGASTPGNFVDSYGKVLGRHKGIIHYTIGQRKGLGIALGKPVFITDIKPEKNEIVVGEESEIFSDTLYAVDTNFISIENLEKEMKVSAKIRYSAKESPAIIRPAESGKVMISFEQRQRAVTPGQSVVFYDGDTVVGGGVIEKR